MIIVATITMDVAIRRAWQASLQEQISLALSQKAQLFADRIASITNHDLQSIAQQVGRDAHARATIITSAGVVLADTEADPQEMENHSTRPEFRAALQGRIGSDMRRSHTLGIEFLYVAAPVEGGAVRLAYPLADLRQIDSRVRRALLEASGLALLLAALLAGAAAHLIARRLKRIMEFAEQVAGGNFSARLQEDSRDEIAQVAAVLDRTARELESSFSRLKSSRAELETVMNSMHDAVLAVGADRKLLWANGAAERLLGNSVRLGAPLIEISRDPEVIAATETALNGGGQTSTIRDTLPGRAFQLTAAPMPNGAAVLVLHDISDVERTEKTRRDFVANVSHELRTPLTSIRGYAETLLEASDGQIANREFLEIIQRNATRMGHLTEDLLTLARVESGDQKLNIASVPARDLLQTAAMNLRNIVRDRGIAIEIADNIDAVVSADRDSIQQVFNNLIENAVKYAGDGRRIEIGGNKASGSVEFYVRDFGLGIASEHLPRLFERFYRVDKARSQETGGTGLGLAIVKHIILNHGGSVRAESKLGHGATFYFTLPLAHSTVAHV